MQWLENIKQPKQDPVPMVIIGKASKLRDNLVAYLIQQGFDPIVSDGHNQAAQELKARKRTGELPACIISGYQCDSGTNAAAFLGEGSNLDVPFIAVVKDREQRNAVDRHKPRLCLSEKDLEKLILPEGCHSEAAVEFLALLEKYRGDRLRSDGLGLNCK